MPNEATLRLLRWGFALGGQVAPGPMARLALRFFVRPPRIAAPPRELALSARGTPLVFACGLSATSFGPVDAKPVLLVHGWAGRGLQLGAFVDPLVAQGFRVVALDGPAHGASPGHETNPIHFAEALLEVGSELGPLRAIVAHSFGGAATVLALDRGLAVDRVVLIASPADLVRVLYRFSEEVGLPRRGAEKLLKLIAERLGAPAETASMVNLAPRMKQPLLLVHDPADTEVPFADAQAMARAWPGAELWEARGLGHRRVLRAPESVAKVVGFVRGEAR